MKFIISKILLVVGILNFISCQKDLSPSPLYILEEITLNIASAEMEVGERMQLFAQCSPMNLELVLTWSSSAPNIVSVNNSGAIEALAPGNAKITVSALGQKAECQIVVEEPLAPVKQSEYTLMLYGCAGGNLDQFIMDNLKNAAEHGSTDKVKMTALLKYSKHVSSKPNTIFYDLQGNEFVETNYADKKFDMSLPENVTNFIKESMELYPAKKYIFITTNHGSEWDSEYDKPQNAMIFDDNTNTALSIYSLAEGIKNSGVKMDIVYPDICLFSMLEFINELDGITNYVLSSSNLVPGVGGDYYDLLRILDSKEDTKAAMIEYCEEVISFWNKDLGFYKSPIDINFVDPSKINQLYDPIIQFKERFLQLKNDSESQSIYQKAVNAQKLMYYFDGSDYENSDYFSSTDVVDAFKRISDATGDMAFNRAYSNLLKAIDEFCIISKSDHYSEYLSNEDGFTFGIQWSRNNAYVKQGFAEGYEESKFDKATKWNEFLRANVD